MLKLPTTFPLFCFLEISSGFSLFACCHLVAHIVGKKSGTQTFHAWTMPIFSEELQLFSISSAALSLIKSQDVTYDALNLVQ